MVGRTERERERLCVWNLDVRHLNRKNKSEIWMALGQMKFFDGQCLDLVFIKIEIKIRIQILTPKTIICQWSYITCMH